MDGSYTDDVEFKKLLSRRADIDLTVVALEIARDADATLDFSAVSTWIQDRANELLGPVSRADSEREALARLGSCLYGQHGIRGQNNAYECGEGSYLHRVIETQSGIPISLSLLYMGVAEKLGIDLRGVSAPSHFLTRLDSLDGPIFLDAYGEGRLLDLDECLQWFGSVTEMGRDDLDLLLRPADARSIVTRMLMNLKVVHTKREDWNLAARVQHRLMALMPASYTERRDLALITARTSRTGEAIGLLRACLKDCPDDDREVLQHCIDMARKQHSRWN
ncbi:MAG: transglutaminase-like domain-containing protein [Planctomycetaceae bacterium]